jgi:hypothetical protein
MRKWFAYVKKLHPEGSVSAGSLEWAFVKVVAKKGLRKSWTRDLENRPFGFGAPWLSHLPVAWTISSSAHRSGVLASMRPQIQTRKLALIAP